MATSKNGYLKNKATQDKVSNGSDQNVPRNSKKKTEFYFKGDHGCEVNVNIV